MLGMALTATSVIAASAAHAITFDEAASLLPAKEFAALREAPSSVTEALSDASRMAGAWKAGRLPAKAAADATAKAVDRLAASWSDLATASGETRRAAHAVAVLVLATDVKTLMVASEWRADGPLAVAVDGWLFENARGWRPMVDDRPPDVDCTQNLLACYQYCANLRDFVSRSVCGIDCELSFLGCVGGVLGELTTGLVERIAR